MKSDLRKSKREVLAEAFDDMSDAAGEVDAPYITIMLPKAVTRRIAKDLRLVMEHIPNAPDYDFESAEFAKVDLENGVVTPRDLPEPCPYIPDYTAGGTDCARCGRTFEEH